MMVIYKIIDIIWIIGGNGPVIISYDDNVKSWFIDGVNYTKDEYDLAIGEMIWEEL